MSQRQHSRIRHIFNHNYKWVSTLTTILLLDFTLYILLSQISPTELHSEEQASSSNLAKGILLQDDFSNSTSGWPSGSQTNSSFGYQSPHLYYLEVSAPHNTATAFRGLNLANFIAQAKVVVNYTDTPTEDFRMGLAVRRSGDSYYAFTFSPRTQTGQVSKHSPDGMKVLAEEKFDSPRVTYQLITLTVTIQDTNFSFRINDQSAIEATDPDYASGDVGFILETFDENLAHVIYDSLVIRGIDGAMVTVLPSATATTSSALRLSSMPTPTSILLPTLTPSPLPPATSVFLTSTPNPFPPPTLSPTFRATPPPPTSTSSSLPTATPLPPTPTSNPSPTATLVPPTPTPSSSPTPSLIFTATPLPPTTIPSSTPPVSPTLTPMANLPTGTFVLLQPLDLNKPTFGPTDFEWEWTGPVQPGFGFEVRVWREGEPITGVHDAVQDNQNGNIKSIGSNKYTLNVNIKDAAGVRGYKGEYLWTVALVQISPSYADLGQQAPPARLRFETAGGSDHDGRDSGRSGSGDGVGID